jgi:hypothetical protein
MSAGKSKLSLFGALIAGCFTVKVAAARTQRIRRAPSPHPTTQVPAVKLELWPAFDRAVEFARGRRCEAIPSVVAV